MNENSNQYTPGPWVIFSDKGIPRAIIPAGRPGDICTFDDNCVNPEQNAELIRRLPEILRENKRLKEEIKRLS